MCRLDRAFLLALVVSIALGGSTLAWAGECYRLDLEVFHNVLHDWIAQQGSLREALGDVAKEDYAENLERHPADLGMHGVVPMLRVPLALFPLAHRGDELIVSFEPQGDQLCVESLRLAEAWDGGELFATARVHALLDDSEELLITSDVRFPLSSEEWEQLRFEENRRKFVTVLACRRAGGELEFLGLEYIGALPEEPVYWK